MVAPTACKPPAFGVVQVSLDSCIISLDDAYASFLGVPREDAVGRRISEFIAEDIGAGGPETMISIIVRTGEPMSIRRTFVRPDGTTLRAPFSFA
jgi:PAS domain-containing protein